MKYIQFFLVCLVCAFCSCDSLTTTLDTDDEEFFAQRMVIGSIIDVNTDVIWFFVGENRSFLEEGRFEDFNLSGASITIEKDSSGEIIDFVNGDEFPEERAENYRYILDEAEANFVEAGSYTFSVGHPDYPESETSLTIPEKGQIENVEFDFEAGIDLNGDEISSLTFDILDQPGPDFYELQVLIDGRQVAIETFDPSGSKGNNFSNLLFRDDSFDGQRKRIEVNFNRFFWNPSESETIALNWISVNEGYFLLSKSVQRQSETIDNPFSSAVQINGNVNDALGVIGFRNSNVFEITP